MEDDTKRSADSQASKDVIDLLLVVTTAGDLIVILIENGKSNDTV